MQPEIQRFCWFDTVGQKGTARETIWKYKRAIEGHKLVLVGVNIACAYSATGIVNYQVYDGHTYSHWGSFPGIFDQSTLAIFRSYLYESNMYLPLNNWECKEVTFSTRIGSDGNYVQFAMILWFYEIPMTKAETFEYAVKQPRYKIRHGSARTLDRFED